MDLIGLPLILATSAAEPAVEPKSIEPALRNSSALLEPADCTQTMPIPSLANSFSRSPFCFSTIDTGLYVAQSMRISLSASAATAAPGASMDAAIAATKVRREIPGMSVLQKTLCFLKELISHVNEKIAAAEQPATRRALLKTQ